MSPLGAAFSADGAGVELDGEVAADGVELDGDVATGGDIAGLSLGCVDCARAPDSINALTAVTVAKVLSMVSSSSELQEWGSHVLPHNAPFRTLFRRFRKGD